MGQSINLQGLTVEHEPSVDEALRRWEKVWEMWLERKGWKEGEWEMED